MVTFNLQTRKLSCKCDLVTFTEEILDQNLQIFCTVLEEDRGEGKVDTFFPSSNLTQEASMHIDTTCNMLTKFD